MIFSIVTKKTNFGEKKSSQEDVQFHQVMIMLPTFIQTIYRNFKSGDLVALEGALVYRKWKDKMNKERKSAQILISNSQHYIYKLDSSVIQQRKVENQKHYTTRIT